MNRPSTVRLAAVVLSAMAMAACGSGLPADPSPMNAPPPTQARAAQPPSPTFASGADVLRAVQQAQTLTTVPSSVADQLAVSDDAAPAGYFDCKKVPASENPSNASGFGQCAWGDPRGTKLMVLYGDGHGEMWKAALAGVAAMTGYKLRVFALGSCPVLDLQFWAYDTKSPNTACDQFHATALPAIEALHPDVIVATSAWGKQLADNTEPTAAQWQQGWDSTLSKLSHTGAKVAVLGDIPSWPTNNADCLKTNLQESQQCSAPAQQAASPAVGPEQAAAAAAQAQYIPTTPWVCADRCQPVIADRRVYNDEFHLTQTYVRYVTGALGETLKPQL